MRNLVTAFLVAAFLLAAIASAPALSQDSAHGPGKYSVAGLEDREVEAFFLSFKEAVTKNDKAKVASMVSYPIRAALASGRSARIKNRRAFVRSYDAIFDKKFKRLIAKTEVKDLWAKWSGVATPRGEIWINGVYKDKRQDEYEIKITSINGPIFR